MRAMLNAHKTLNLKNVRLMVADPFYSFKNPRYNAVNVIPGQKKTYPKKHEVYEILPKYFPQPYSNNNDNSKHATLQKKEKSLNDIIAKAKNDLKRLKARRLMESRRKPAYHDGRKTKHKQKYK